MKNSELQGLSIDELKGKLAAEEENLRKLKFAHAVTPLENPMRIRHTRKLVARLQTFLRKKELETI